MQPPSSRPQVTFFNDCCCCFSFATCVSLYLLVCFLFSHFSFVFVSILFLSVAAYAASLTAPSLTRYPPRGPDPDASEGGSERACMGQVATTLAAATFPVSR
jgi:hypothetical protein